MRPWVLPKGSTQAKVLDALERMPPLHYGWFSYYYGVTAEGHAYFVVTDMYGVYHFYDQNCDPGFLLSKKEDPLNGQNWYIKAYERDMHIVYSQGRWFGDEPGAKKVMHAEFSCQHFAQKCFNLTASNGNRFPKDGISLLTNSRATY